MLPPRELVPRQGIADRRDAIALGAILFIALALVWVFGELIPVGRGFGFGDGRTYGRLGMSFPDFRYVDEYRMARVLPSLTVNVAHRLLPGAATVGMTVRLFRLMNVLLLVASSQLWFLIARHWSLRRAATWIGFVGLFVNFSNLKFALYYPTLTDTAAFAFGMLLLYAFLIRSIRLTGFVAAAGAFISPPLMVCALVLLVIPRIDTDPLALPPRALTSRLGTGVALLAGVGLGWQLWQLDSGFEGWIVSGGEPVWRGWLWLSISIVVGYAVLGARPLLLSLVAAGPHWVGRLAGSRERLMSLLGRLAVAGLLVVIAFATYQLGVEVTARETGILFDRMLYSSVARPLASVVGHVLHFGPIIVLAMMLWPRSARHIHRFGPGTVLLFLGILVLGLTSESRTITALLPFVVAFTALSVDRLEWRMGKVAIFAALSLIVSRVWFPINQGAIDQLPYLEFPSQFYFMNFGPWMSNQAYWVFMAGLGVVTVITVLLVRVTGARRHSVAASPPDRFK